MATGYAEAIMAAARRREAARRAELAQRDPQTGSTAGEPDRQVAQTIRLPATMWQELSTIARRQGMTRAALVRGMLYCEVAAFRGAGGPPQ